jgi:hypothetical protein
MVREQLKMEIRESDRICIVHSLFLSRHERKRARGVVYQRSLGVDYDEGF